MIESVVITLFPALFLIVLFGGGEVFRRRNINMDGEPPINRRLFYLSKYSILIVWIVMVLHCWGINLFSFNAPGPVKRLALFLWITGFMLLFIGRFGLGDSFRIGSPQERTDLKVNGLFSVSRNPMYLGVYATLLAPVLYTLNPILSFVGVFVAAVHHRIVLAEEQHLRKVFGKKYLEYCSRVRRYL